MYWLVILDNITAAGVTFFVLGFAVFVVAAIGHSIEGWSKSISVLSLCVVLVALAILTFVPSTRQMAAIIVVPKIANSEKIQLAGNKLYDLAVEWMDELRPSKGEKETKPCKQ